jgi:hypothetical protein
MQRWRQMNELPLSNVKAEKAMALNKNTVQLLKGKTTCLLYS